MRARFSRMMAATAGLAVLTVIAVLGMSPSGRDVPAMLFVKPQPCFFGRPTVPFQFNADTCYKMLLAREETRMQSVSP
jgi:hypothetical protein